MLERRTDELGIYLNDHFAGAAGGLALFRRGAEARRGEPAGEVLARLAAEIAEDRTALREVMAAVGAPVHRSKVAAGWVAERVSRLKPNGRLLSRSPLSDYLELEAMLVGVHGKWAGWRTLLALAERDPRLDRRALEELSRRAGRQVEALEELRAQTLERAFGSRRGERPPVA
ncbi:hypothetical protein CLV92_109101 [Kineococcus xinjiangensis]|uniref:Uncharacterized protein n=1 Tax=Kineococcus xinjiangensis TaxID=512762 RepID=A0A2S6IHY1_9ACTN|nr:hypothetical protein [Kineococcus xinjiangensis]PPK93824.1 hypothetical protein CLV92_109101 [Kineococcus xinjiangensis]